MEHDWSSENQLSVYMQDLDLQTLIKPKPRRRSQILRAIRWLILLLLVGALLGALALLQWGAPIYAAESILQVAAPASALGNENNGAVNATQSAALRDSFIAVVKQRDTRSTVLQQLGLSSDLSYRLAVRPVDEANFVRVSVYAANPELAVALNNMHVDESLRRFAGLRALPLNTLADQLSLQLTGAERRVKEAEGALAAFQEREGIVSVANELIVQQEALAQLNTERDRLLLLEGPDDERLARAEALIIERRTEIERLLDLQSTYQELAADLNAVIATSQSLRERESQTRLAAEEAVEVNAVQMVEAASLATEPESNLLEILLLLGVGLITIALYWSVFLHEQEVRPSISAPVRFF